MRTGRAIAKRTLVGRSQLSYAQVYDAHVETVYRYVHRRCRDHSLAEDVTQDTFMTAIRKSEDPDSIKIGWLITIARNRLLDILRRQTRYQQKLRLLADTNGQANENGIAERLRVEAALVELPVQYRLVLTLHYINDMTVRAIAEELGQSHKSVEGLVTRARRELIEMLGDADTDGMDGDNS